MTTSRATTRRRGGEATRDPNTLRLHPHAGLIPQMLADEYQAFLADVKAHGIIAPLDITPAGVVLDGRHRLQAARETNQTRVPIRIVTPEDEVDYLVRQAVLRRQLTPSQRAAIIVAHHAHQDIDVATLPTPTNGRTRDAIANLAGVSPRLVQDAHTVHQHDPDLFAQVRDGYIAAHRAANRIRRTQRDNHLTTPRLPRGRFQVIYADPPWQLGNPESKWSPEQHYPTLPPTETIKALPVPAAADAVLFLWAVSSLLPDALEVLSAWGFTCKDDAGVGEAIDRPRRLGRNRTRTPPHRPQRGKIHPPHPPQGGGPTRCSEPPRWAATPKSPPTPTR